MKGFLLFCLATSSSTNNLDAEFNTWCSDIGISCPRVEVRTTPESVASRGVFTTDDVSEGDELISIPLYVALTQDNARRYFPTLAQKLEECRGGAQKQPGRIKRIWNRILRRRPARDEPISDDDYWQSELTAYAMQALEVNHPWSTWISQWQRDDPLQSLVDKSTWRMEDDESTQTAVSDFHSMAPDIPEYKIHAAVGIRLQELDEYNERYSSKDGVLMSESMYTTLISRAIGLSETVTAILPMHDMINHSDEPNVAMEFGVEEDEAPALKMVATRDMPKGCELFNSYYGVTDDEGVWDEDKAAWLLAQWGIPSSRPNSDLTSKVDKDASLVPEGKSLSKM